MKDTRQKKNPRPTAGIFTLCFERCPGGEHGVVAPGIASGTKWGTTSQAQSVVPCAVDTLLAQRWAVWVLPGTPARCGGSCGPPASASAIVTPAASKPSLWTRGKLLLASGRLVFKTDTEKPKMLITTSWKKKISKTLNGKSSCWVLIARYLV